MPFRSAVTAMTLCSMVMVQQRPLLSWKVKSLVAVMWGHLQGGSWLPDFPLLTFWFPLQILPHGHCGCQMLQWTVYNIRVQWSNVVCNDTTSSFSLSVAGFLHRAGCSMLARTRSRGSGVGHCAGNETLCNAILPDPCELSMTKLGTTISSCVAKSQSEWPQGIPAQSQLNSSADCFSSLACLQFSIKYSL